jgi:hypothetical protein
VSSTFSSLHELDAAKTHLKIKFSCSERKLENFREKFLITSLCVGGIFVQDTRIGNLRETFLNFSSLLITFQITIKFYPLT